MVFCAGKKVKQGGRLCKKGEERVEKKWRCKGVILFQMLPKNNRLKKTKDFETVFKTGKSIRNSFLALKVTQNNLDISRFAFVISKKISKKAVVRNKIRRRLSATIEKEIKDIKKGFDFIFLTQSGIEKVDFLKTKESAVNLLEKANFFLKSKSKNV
jgi:ribonuclease P protein component